MNDKEVLAKVRVLIAKGWTIGAYARDEQGEVVTSADPKACKWCLSGALFCAVGTTDIMHPMVESIRSRLHSIIGGINLPTWNDTRALNQTKVLEVIDAAIAAC